MKWRRTLSVFACSLAMIMGFHHLARAQSDDTAQVNRVNLGGAAGAPGTRLTVPIYFTPAAGVRAGQLKLSVRYISNSLKFEKLQPALNAELDGIAFQAQTTQSKNDKGLNEQTLTITAASGDAKPIPGGLIAYANFVISEEGKAATITLRTTAEASDLPAGVAITPLKTFDAEVEVQLPGEPPAVICFFFTH